MNTYTYNHYNFVLFIPTTEPRESWLINRAIEPQRVFIMKLLLRQQAECVPPFTYNELQRPALMHQSGRGGCLGGYQEHWFKMLCDHIASRGNLTPRGFNKAFTIISVTLTGMAVASGIRALYPGLRKRVLLNFPQTSPTSIRTTQIGVRAGQLKLA